MSGSTAARKKLTWRLIFMSSGEITLRDHAQTVGRRVKAGAEVRLLNIDADAGAALGIFENLHGAASADVLSRQLKEAARTSYGAPLREYISFLICNIGRVETSVRRFIADFLKRNVPAGASGEVSRAAQRFALIAAAGEIATEAGVTGWSTEDATNVATSCFRSWLANRNTMGAADMDAALRQVRHFLEMHGASRFERIPHGSAGDSPRIINRAGFVRNTSDGTEYLILRETFRAEVCAGYDHRAVLKELDQQGLLHREHPAMTIKARLPELDCIRIYCIRAAILDS
jgi:uncharacterized protein (DUF927 family)